MSYNEAERVQLRQMLVSNGVKPERATQCVDLACHAAERAVEALGNVIKTAPDAGIGLMAYELALQLATPRFQGILERTRALGREAGLPLYQGAVEIRT